MLPSTAGLLLVIPLPTISLSSVYLVVLVGGAQIISWTSFLSFIVLAVGTPLITWTTTISSQSLITWVTSYSRSISFYHVVVHYPAVAPSLSYRPPSCCCPHHPAVVQHSSWWIASYWWIAVLGLLPSIYPLSTIHHPTIAPHLYTIHQPATSY